MKTRNHTVTAIIAAFVLAATGGAALAATGSDTSSEAGRAALAVAQAKISPAQAIAAAEAKAGGKATGVEPQFFIDMEYQYDEITELIVTKDMTERKMKMIELGDVFIAFPGGTGTLEEIAEVMSKVSLGHLDAPCILYDLDGYYAGLKALLAHMVEMGLSSPERQSGIYFVKNLDEIKSILKRA